MNRLLCLIACASFVWRVDPVNAVELSVPELPGVPMPRWSPKPERVAGIQSPSISLNGTWRFSPEGNAGPEAKEIRVPGEWAMQGFTVPSGAFAEYYHAFTVPADWSGAAIKLRFDAVHAVCKVSVNDVELGGHEGGFVPFEIDATRAIKAGAQNTIRVKVQSESIADAVACMSQYAGHQVGGIVRKVTLVALPKLNLAEQVETTVFDKNFRNATLRLKVGVANESSAAADATLDFELLDAAGKQVASLGGKNIAAIGAGKIVVSEFDIPVSAPAKWTSETPVLYTLRTTLRGGQTTVRRIGFRQVEVRGKQVFVNGAPVKLLGACRHEVHPLTGRSVSAELCREDVKLFREGNCNFLRTSHYPPSEEFLDACDELGMFVESEAAITWIKHHASPVWNTWNHLDPQYFPYLLRPNLDNVVANRAHPSVIIWSLANESLWTPLFARVNEEVKKADPSRPTTFHDQCWGSFNNAGSKADIAVYHYPGEGNSHKWSELDRPSYFGEYVHVQCYNRRELVTDPFVRADWGRPFARMVDLMWDQSGCMGGAIWSGIDDVFHLPDGKLTGYGHWGVIDGWRRKKPEWYGMRQAYAPVRCIGAESPRPVKDGKVSLVIQNRYNFTSLRECHLEWVCGKARGKHAVNLAPHQRDEFLIPLGGTPDADTLQIRVVSPAGVEMLRDSISLLLEKPLAEPMLRAAVATLKETGDAVVVRQNEVNYRFDKTSGELTIERAGVTVSRGAIGLMVLPLNGSGGAAGPAGSTLSNAPIEPFTPLCGGGKLRGVTATRDGRSIKVVVSQAFDEAEGSVTVAFNDAEEVRVDYSYRMAKEINPRQWGVVFSLPRQFDHLTWDGRGIGAADKEDIGRPQGEAKADPVAGDGVETVGKNLTGSLWAQDANALGTNDFRSTKHGIRRASLDNGQTALTAGSNGSAASRCWVDGEVVRWLVAGFNTGGSDGFFDTHYAAERRPLKAGDVITGGFTLGCGPK